MSELIKTLHKKGDASVEIYPNIKPANIPASAINTSKLEDNSITTSKITDGAVTNEKIADGSITTAKIGDNAITYAKIAMGSITNDKIADGAVITAKIEDNAVTNAKILNTTIEPIKLKMRIIMHLGTLKVTDNGNDYYFPYALMEFTDNTLNEITDFADFKAVWMALYDDYAVPFSKGTTAQFGVSNLTITLPDNTSIIADENNVDFEDTFSHTIY